MVVNSLALSLVILALLTSSSSEDEIKEPTEDAFDFDGIPGVNHEFKVDVPGLKQDCFFQFAAKEASLYVNYEVLRGGDRLITVLIFDQHGELVKSEYEQNQGMLDLKITESGYYEVCIDNTNSRYGSKLVYVYLLTIVLEDWAKHVEDLEEVDGLAVNMTAILAGVEKSIIDVEQYQIQSRLSVILDWYLIAANNIYVGYWSMALCVVVVASSVGQVFFLRRLFKTTNVTPSAKPRA